MSEDYILIGGGLLIALVIMHGIWLAWRARQDPLPLEIEPDASDYEFDVDELGAEFPNGGARVVGSAAHTAATQRPLPFEGPAPVLMEVVDEGEAIAGRFGADAVKIADRSLGRSGERSGEKSSERSGESRGEKSSESSESSESRGENRGERRGGNRAEKNAERRPEIAAENRPEKAATVSSENGAANTPGNGRGAEPMISGAGDAIAPARISRDLRNERRRAPRARNSRARETARPDLVDVAEGAAQHEILAINVLARGHGKFNGSDLWAAFQRNGLTFGDMNIFHRLNPVTRTPQYSVANAIEPGTFDLSSMESMKTRGACLFLRLPGPSEPAATFDDMLRVARDIGQILDGELKDENFSVLTAQTEEHYRQRIAEFSRKRMSKRY